MPLDTFDDHELDQYLPNGLPNSGHMVSHNQSEQYSSCYQGNAVTSTASSWCFRPSTGSCMQSYSSQNSSSAGSSSNLNNNSSSNNNNNNIPSPYDLSSNNSPPHTAHSPNNTIQNSQTSSPGSIHSPGYPSNGTPTSNCKLRDDVESGVKIEPTSHSRGPAPRYPCDSKFDYNATVAVSRFENGAHTNMAYAGSNAHAQYMHSLNYPHMGMSRQMFNPIAAAVPGEPQWERYTWKCVTDTCCSTWHVIKNARVHTSQTSSCDWDNILVFRWRFEQSYNA